MNVFKKLWNDDGGFIISTELLLIITVLIIGIVGGLAALRAGMASQLTNLGSSINQLNPGFHIVSVGSTTGGSNGTLIIHAGGPVGIGAANAVTTQTNTGTDDAQNNLLPITP